jgi:dienelactone hydrolase
MMRRIKSLLVVLLVLAALPGLVAVAAGLLFARMMINPPRTKQWKTPRDEGWEFENVFFEADDRVPISSWFIPAPAAGPRPAVVIAHGWTWNRLGTMADDPVSQLLGASPVELMEPARVLRDAGYHLLMPDLRNHGRSGSGPVVTFGQEESKDLAGAVSYLQGRQDVDGERIAILGYSMGASAAMFACSQTDQIKAAVLVQPERPHTFAHRLAKSLLGPLGSVAVNVARSLYYRSGGPLLETLDPAIVADLARTTATLFLQGDGDPWGSPEDVRRLYELSNEPKTLRIVPSHNRYDGYIYLEKHPDLITDYFAEHLA